MSDKHTSSRREFIANASKASLAAGLSFTVLPSLAKGFGGQDFYEPDYKQHTLPYGFKDLEPNIDAITMEIHYTKHAATYAKNLADAMQAEYKKPDQDSLTKLFAEISRYSEKMRNNAGGHYNHELFWQCMTPKSTGGPQGTFSKALNMQFGGLDKFKIAFSDAAKARFGSGWAWLILTPNKALKITSTANQDNPLMNIAEVQGTPLLCLDVWEHAYYLKYQNKRPDYIANWWNVVNWEFVQWRYEKQMQP
jgi:Fe-Mn family superoxide dismutase